MAEAFVRTRSRGRRGPCGYRTVRVAAAAMAASALAGQPHPVVRRTVGGGREGSLCWRDPGRSVGSARRPGAVAVLDKKHAARFCADFASGDSFGTRGRGAGPWPLDFFYSGWRPVGVLDPSALLAFGWPPALVLLGARFVGSLPYQLFLALRAAFISESAISAASVAARLTQTAHRATLFTV